MLSIKALSKKIGSFALKEVSFSVDTGGYFVLLGMSGSGKTMLLEIIAGIRKPDSGQIFIDGQDMTDVRANKRGIGLVFQDNVIFPHLNVKKNIAYPLVGKGFTKSDIHSRVLKWAETINITNLLDRKPAGLSGGEIRRVALARTLAMEPRILLLDEPLSSLDVLIQYDMMQLLKKLNLSGQTIIHVTHDYNEAFSLGNKLAVINNGIIEQTGTPAEVFIKPASRFVAALAGIRNYYSCIESESIGELTRLTIKEGIRLFSSEPCQSSGSFFIREDEILISEADDLSEINIFEGIVKDVIPSPDFYSIAVDAGITFFVRINYENMKSMKIIPEQSVRIKIPPKSIKPVG